MFAVDTAQKGVWKMRRIVIVAFIVGLICSSCIIVGKDIRVLSSDGKSIDVEALTASEIGKGNVMKNQIGFGMNKILGGGKK